MSYHVRVADPATARSDLCALWTRNLEACRAPQRRLDWFYLENPAGRGVVHLLERDGLEAAGPVGCMGIGTRTYLCNGRTVSVALLGDLAVDQKHRALGPALLLQRATRTHAQEHFSLSLGYPNAKALPTVLRTGFRELGPMVRFAVPLRFHTYVRRRMSEPVATAAAVVLDAAIILRLSPAFFASVASFRLENLAAPDARFDELWHRARASFSHVAERSAAFLHWRFLRKPDPGTHRFFAITRRRTRAVVAYAVVESEGRTAHLRDLFGDSPKSIAALLDRLLPTLCFEGHVSASFAFLGAPWLIDLLTKRRFTPRDRRTVVMDWGKDAPATPETLLDRTAWFLTEADEDA